MGRNAGHNADFVEKADKRPLSLSMEKQRRVIDLLCEGLDNFGVARELGVCYGAAKIYVGIVLNRTGHKNRTSLVSAVLWGKIRALEIELARARSGRAA